MQTIQTTIARPWREVCDFLGQARNYPRWASWIGAAIEQHDGDWVTRTPDGRRAKVRFSERNAFGVADHCVLASADETRFVALRALPLPADDGACAVLLTLFDEPRAVAAAQDLARLKALIEQR